MWTDPLRSTTEEFYFTEGVWREISITDTAPVGGSRPVFHTRLTFQAGQGSTIDIDDVEMQVAADVCIDWDGDGYGDPGSPACSAGDALDCDDANSAVNPGQSEICVNVGDEDCNGLSDDDDPACSIQSCAELGEACAKNFDCCSETCSKGKPSSRACQ